MYFYLCAIFCFGGPGSFVFMKEMRFELTIFRIQGPRAVLVQVKFLFARTKRYTEPLLAKFVSFERGRRGLSNDTNFVKNGSVYRFVRAIRNAIWTKTARGPCTIYRVSSAYVLLLSATVWLCSYKTRRPLPKLVSHRAKYVRPRSVPKLESTRCRAIFTRF